MNVTEPALALAGRSVERPTACTDVPITFSQPDLVLDEAWSATLQVLLPGATFWRDLSVQSGTGPFAASAGLYLCPTDPLGTYGLRAQYAIAAPGAIGPVKSQVATSAVTVNAAYIPPPVVETAKPATSAVTLHVSRSGKKLQVSGLVKVNGAGEKGLTTKLQKKISGKWKTIKTFKTAAKGKFAVSILSKAKLSLRVYLSRTVLHMAAVSKTVKK